MKRLMQMLAVCAVPDTLNPSPKDHQDLSQYASDDPIVQELNQWFFVEYFDRWVAVGNQSSTEGPEFIFEYWGVPMFITHPDPKLTFWLTTREDLLKLLALNHEPLQKTGYTHTVVPDRKITVTSDNGAVIDTIWSRRRADESEVERVGARFQVGRINGKWIVLGVHGVHTTEERVDQIWRY